MRLDMPQMTRPGTLDDLRNIPGFPGSQAPQFQSPAPDGTQAGGGAPSMYQPPPDGVSAFQAGPTNTFQGPGQQAMSRLMAQQQASQIQPQPPIQQPPAQQSTQQNSLLSLLHGLGAPDGTQAGGGAPSFGGGGFDDPLMGAPPSIFMQQGGGTGQAATAPLSPDIQSLLQSVNLPQFRGVDLGPLEGQAQARAAQTEARMNRNTRNAFGNSGVQARGPAMAGEMNLNAARANSGLEDTISRLGIEEANMYNTNAPRFGSLMVDLINSGNARQGQSLNFLAQMLSGLGSFV
jgi:hypothetical protein